MQLRRLLVIRPAYCGTVVTGQVLFLPRFAIDDLDPPAAAVAAVGAVDLDGLHPRLGLRPNKVDVQQPIVEPRTLHLDPLGEHEGPLELPRRDPAVQEDTSLALVSLTSPDYQLVVFLRDLQVVHGESGNRERYAQPRRAGLLDVVRRIAVRRGLRRALKHLLEMVEAQEQR